MFIGLLTSVVNASNHAKCVSLNNQQCMIQTTLLIYILINTLNKGYLLLSICS